MNQINSVAAQAVTTETNADVNALELAIFRGMIDHPSLGEALAQTLSCYDFSSAERRCAFHALWESAKTCKPKRVPADITKSVMSTAITLANLAHEESDSPDMLPSDYAWFRNNPEREYRIRPRRLCNHEIADAFPVKPGLGFIAISRNEDQGTFDLFHIRSATPVSDTDAAIESVIETWRQRPKPGDFDYDCPF